MDTQFPKDRHFLVRVKVFHFSTYGAPYKEVGTEIKEVWFHNGAYHFWCGTERSQTTDTFKMKHVLAWSEIPDALKETVQ